MSTRDYGAEAHAAAEEHWTAVHEWFVFGEYGEDGEEAPVEPDAAGPYCGCETCQVREILHAAWPILEEGAIAFLVERMQEWAEANVRSDDNVDWAGFRLALLGDGAE